MADIKIEDITTGEVNGTGVFDILMQRVEKSLDTQFKKSRIKGDDYAQVYLGAMTAVLQQSIAFVLGEQQADKQADLIEQQIVTEQKQTDLMQSQIDKVDKEIELQEEAKYIARAQVTDDLTVPPSTIVDAQGVLGGQIDNLVKEGLQIDANTALINSNKSKVDYEVTNLYPEQLTKLQEEVDLLQSQDLKVQSDKLAVDQQTSNLAAEALNIPKAGLKLDAEKSLLDQKTTTETAQTQQSIADADSVIGKQKELYTAQTDGFARDAEQKGVKIISEMWGVGATIADDGTLPDVINPTGQDGLGKALEKLLNGISVNPTV